MSLSHSPSIVTSGLVLYYDMNNTQKSWKGAPTTNLIISPSDFTDANWLKTRSSVTSNTTTAPDGTLTADTFIEDTSVTNSHYIYQPVSVTNALVYTKSIYVKAKERSYCAIQFYATNSAFTSSAAYFNLNTGVVTSVDASITNSSISNIGNGWYRISASSTATATASGNIAFHLSSGALATYYTGDGTSGIYIWGAQLEVNSFPTPFVTGSRTTTTALLDLTNNNTLTATSLTYASGNTFSFNGTTDYLSIPSSTGLNPTTAITMESWVKFSTTGTRMIWFGKGDGVSNPTTQYWMEKTVADKIMIYLSFGASAPNVTLSNTTITAGVWNHIVATYDGATIKGYVNGVIDPTTYSYVGTLNTTSTILSIGRLGTYGSLYINGSITNVKLYNTALTADQVLQNFNALKGRYL